MTKLIKLSVIPLVMGVTAANATNGTNLFGFTTVNQGMGGTGLAYPAGSSSALMNPALIHGNEVSFGVTYFKPTVSTNPMGAGEVDSAMDKSVIPNLTFAFELNERMTMGVGMYGSAGVGVDYRDDQVGATNKMLTNLQNMKFAVPVAYQVNDDLRVGASLVALYGSLDMSYDNPMDATAANVGNGVSQDYGFGYELGMAYKIPYNNITLAATYQSAIEMEYANQIASASSAFMLNGGQGFGDNLDQPSEYGVGVSYQKHIGDVTHVFNADYKKINWSAAAGYEDFGWEDQNVIALGYEYNRGKMALRAGYNYATSPIKEQTGTTAGEIMPGYDAAATNYFNLVGFPAIVESHYTTGASYQLTEKMRLDVSYVYTPEKVEEFDTSAMTGGTTSVETKHSQSTLAVGFNIKF